MSEAPAPTAPAAAAERSPLPGPALDYLSEMADWSEERRRGLRTTTIEQLDLVDAKAAALLQFIGVLVAVAAIVASLASLRPGDVRGEMVRDFELATMALLMVAVLFAGACGLSCVHIFDMSGRLRRRKPNPGNDVIFNEATAWLRHVLDSRRQRYRIAYALTWLAFLLIMLLVALHMLAESVPAAGGGPA